MTLKELIEKHGPLPLKISFKGIEGYIEVFYLDKNGKGYGLDEDGAHSFWDGTDYGYELYIEPPKPIVFECQWFEDSLGRVIPTTEKAWRLLQEVKGKETRVTVEVIE